MNKPVALTVIIRDDSPMLVCGDTPKYRRVTFNLEPWQIALMEVKETGKLMGKPIHEDISKVFIEYQEDSPPTG